MADSDVTLETQNNTDELLGDSENANEPVQENDANETNIEDALADAEIAIACEAGDDHISDAEELKMEKEDDDEEEEEDDDLNKDQNVDPNVMPQVNVALLGTRNWQIKVYPLKAGDFVSGQISKVFKNARESLLYIVCQGKNARGKGEMYVSTARQAIKVVHNLMKLDFLFPEVNIEIIKKNNDGTTEQKAFLRFDTKLVRMLCTPSLPRRSSKKLRSRVIGSVFVKNLPTNTTKDMLRVLFPFAAEVNFNPDKFKDGTARLVLENRSYVFPCLKAFAKVELGGNVLELHPLEKKREHSESDKISYSDDEKKPTITTEPEAQTKPADETSAGSENNAGQEVNNTTGNEEENVSTGNQETKPSITPTKPGENKKPFVPRDGQRGRGRGNFNPRRRTRPPGDSGPKMPFYKPDIRRPGPPNRGRPNRNDNRRGGFVRDGPVRSPRRPNQNRGNFAGGNYNRNAGNFNSRNNNSGGRFGGGVSGGNFGRNNRPNRRYNDRSFGNTGAAGPSGDMGVNVEATKEMMLLQNQLSMAIKNQIAMLNQTQLAVEQAKRGAGSLGLAADVLPGSSSLDDSNRSYNKRRSTQAGFGSDYSDDGYGGKRQRTWGEESADYYLLQQQQQQQQQQQLPLDYTSDRHLEDAGSCFGTSYNSRSLSQTNFGYDTSNYGYRY
ncbi:uncharacterized protein LOC131940759 [Physella acuta]|uniref:uncharacterized protein LOC131940759 n=1 Tax=Physella acuta TaxID=109671 RepID=UPI0027DCB775|nr:uncharacterized protein LOC131940759 [Physella acuta]